MELLNKNIFLLLILMFIRIGGTAQDKISSILDKGLPSYASYSVYALDLDSGNLIYASPQRSLTPASIQKLVTSAVALEYLGPEFCFETTLSYIGQIDPQQKILKGDLILKGGGDPVFYSSYFPDHYQNTFRNWATVIQSLDIEKIEGNLILDQSALDENPLPGGWIWEDIGNYYGAGVSALTYSDNLYKIHFRTSAEAGQLAAISFTEPQIPELTLTNKVYSSEIQRDLSIVYGAPGSFHQTIEGTIPKGREDFVVKAALPDPSLLTASHLINNLSDRGITLSGKITNEIQHKNSETKQIALKKSPPLKEILIPLNKESVNLIAEHLLREIGRKANNDPSLESGLKAVYEYLKQRGIPTDGFYPEDGSGLSRSGVTTAQTITQILKELYYSKYRDYFLNSLPVAGKDGTLKNSFRGSVLENNLQAKTGSMERVRSIAGYLKSKGGHNIAFTIIINNFNSSNGKINELFESTLVELWAETNTAGQ